MGKFESLGYYLILEYDTSHFAYSRVEFKSSG